MAVSFWLISSHPVITETRQLSWCQLCRHWWHRKFSFRCHQWWQSWHNGSSVFSVNIFHRNLIWFPCSPPCDFAACLRQIVVGIFRIPSVNRADTAWCVMVMLRSLLGKCWRCWADIGPVLLCKTHIGLLRGAMFLLRGHILRSLTHCDFCNAYFVLWIRESVACRLFGVKPLADPM